MESQGYCHGGSSASSGAVQLYLSINAGHCSRRKNIMESKAYCHGGPVLAQVQYNYIYPSTPGSAKVEEI